MTKTEIAELLYHGAENYWRVELELEGITKAVRPRRSFDTLTPREVALYESQAQSLLDRALVQRR